MTAFGGYRRLAPLIAIALMLAVAGCTQDPGSRDAEKESDSQDASVATSHEPAGPDGNTSAGVSRPNVSPCDSSGALEKVVRSTRPEQFPEHGGAWKGVVAVDNDEVNPGPGYCLKDYAFGFLQPKREGGEFKWVVVARSNWETKIFPTDLECRGDDAVSLTEPPVVEEMLCTTSQGDQASSGGNSGGSDTGEDTGSSDDIEEANLDQEVGDYYRAAGAEEWAYTYDHLASQTRSTFTEDEWSQKNQWLWDRNPVIYHILSITPDTTSQEPLAQVEVRITGEDGSSWTRTTYFVLEDGGWKHRFTEAEKHLFMPDATFEEFVEAQTDSSSEGTPEPAADGVCDPLPGEAQDPDCLDQQRSGFERFVGEWYVHGSQMTIRPDFTGVKSSNAGPCTDPFGPYASDAMCNEIQQLQFSGAPSDGIVATVTSVAYETWDGDPPPPGFQPDGTAQVGDSFELEFVDDGLLRTTWLGRLAYLNGQGNPYWCNSRTSDEDVDKCGA